MKWTLDLCSKLEQFNKTLDEPISFGTNLRVVPNMNTEDLFSALKRCNFKYVNTGLESGSESLRNKLLKRNYSNEDVIRAVTSARKYDLKVPFFNMVGIRGEARADLAETVNMNRICLRDSNYLAISYPYPGTNLYFSCIENGLIKKILISLI